MGDRFSSKFLRGFALSPIPVRVEGRSGSPSEQRGASWWGLLRAWVSYYAIQLRWDFERALSRRLGRRWTSSR